MAKKVAILMGSDSDLPVVEKAFAVLDCFGVEYTARVLSAHRTPVETAAFVSAAEENGYGVVYRIRHVRVLGHAEKLLGHIRSTYVSGVQRDVFELIPKCEPCSITLHCHFQIGGIIDHAFSVGGNGVKQIHEERNESENKNKHLQCVTLDEHGRENHEKGKATAKQDAAKMIQYKRIMTVLFSWRCHQALSGRSGNGHLTDRPTAVRF